ncbi:MAG: hydantoinase B/oxoprolinase family protein [Actinobacteria bacterium]|nr:hydantoinase B/oxoprolinase family protein [Actinomycetota bacterium]
MSGSDEAIELVLLHNRLTSICREMGVAMMRTAYSPVFNEGFDFICALFDREGEMIAQAEYNPSMLGAANFSVGWMVEELGAEAFAPGDVWIHNDPYRGGCHLPEHLLLKGIFHEGELFGFAATIGHVAEIGGKAVGALAGDVTEVYQEGLRLPPVRLMAGGEHVMDVWKIMMTNHRTPKLTWGDLHAMLGSLRIGEQRVEALLAARGVAATRRDVAELSDRSERWMRREIAAIPDGEYAFEDVMDDDGISAEPRRLRVNVAVRGEELIADFTGTDPQTAGPINATFAVTASGTYNAIFQLTDREVPRNAGCYRPIRVIAPPGTLVNVLHPGAEIGGNSETHCRIVGIVIGALAAALPERVAAGDGATGCNFLFGGVHPETGEFYANYHFENVGWGGARHRDGNDSQCVPLAISRNTPIEVFETRYPFVTVGFRLQPDSGGAGRHRGGLGTERILEVRAPEVTISSLFDRTATGSYGLEGGLPGGCASIEVRRRGEERFRPFTEAFGTVSPAKFSNVTVHAGDQIRIVSSGGGGFGDPRERPLEEVRRDVRDRVLSPQRAAAEYGVEVDELSAGVLSGSPD